MLDPQALQPGFPPSLDDPVEIAAWVETLSPYEVDAERIEEMFTGCRAVLRSVDLTTLSINEDINIPDAHRQSECDRLPIETTPPILVEEGKIIDGGHRCRSLIARGQHVWLAYVIEDAPLMGLTP